MALRKQLTFLARVAADRHTYQKLRHPWRLAHWLVRSRLLDRDITIDTLQGRFTFSNQPGHLITTSLYLFRAFDLELSQKVITLLKQHGGATWSRGCLLDIGANIGTVCISLVKDGVFPRAVAVEPAPKNYDYLVRNIIQNGMQDRITARQYGVSSSDGQMELELSRINCGDHRIRTAQTPSNGGVELFDEASRSLITVPVRRLDALLAEMGIRSAEVGLLWMDVQGHEGHVLQGARSLLAAGIPIVLEFWPYALQRAGTDSAELIDLIQTHYASVFDLKEAIPQQRPIGALAALYRQYDKLTPDNTPAMYTNLLLMSS